MIPLFNRRADGILLIEMSLDELQKEWKTAPQQDKIMLERGRPGIKHEGGDDLDPRPIIHTIPEALWDRVKFKLEDLAKWDHDRTGHSRTKLCRECGHELQVVEEYEQVWQMKCKVCEMPHVYGKDLVGGTQGAGVREKT